MQTDTAILGNVPSEESENIYLYNVDGEVISIKGFVRKNLSRLSKLEQELIQKHIDKLPDRVEYSVLPSVLPLTRSAQYSNGQKEIPAKRGGRRSAYVPNLELKIKGCAPENGKFVEWKLDGNYAVKTEKIPYGVLKAESVMREILAYCFMQEHGIQGSATLIAVYEYPSYQYKNRKFTPYALVSRLSDDTRVEKFIDCNGYSLHDIIRLKRSGRLTGHEAGLEGLDKQSYADRKTDLLIAYNFNGGFRGILNSNIGNDVIRDGELYSICDFDTFRVESLPERRDHRGIRRFVMHSFTELVKTSLPFVDYLEFGDVSEEEIHGSLAEYYKANSGIYQSYQTKFMEKARGLDWDLQYVQQCIDGAFKTKVSFELLQELIPNSHTVKCFSPQSYYVPHN